MQMLAIIPTEFPTFAIGHVHCLTQEAVVTDETYNNIYNFANVLVVQRATDALVKQPQRSLPHSANLRDQDLWCYFLNET